MSDTSMEQVLDIREYGAREGSLSTEAIQRAIDLCPPGGSVVIPAGTFVSGALFLKSRMTLVLAEGARLQGSCDLSDYPLMTYGFEGFDQLCYASLLNTDSAPHRDLCIRGSGTIDASGAALFAKEMAEAKGKRGRAVCLRNVENLSIQGVTIRQSPAWCLHLLYCRDVRIEGIRVCSKYDENGKQYEGIYNGDGIDLDSCEEVLVRGCRIESQDDSIAVKSGRDVWGRRTGIPSREIRIEDCSFYSGFGIALGSEMAGGVSDVRVRNCRFENTFSIASIKAVRGRGAYIRDVRFENCRLRNTDDSIRPGRWFRGAIYVDMFYGEETFDPEEKRAVDETTPVIENLSFTDIEAETTQGFGVYLCGLAESPVRDVRFSHVRTKGEEAFSCRNVEGLVLEESEFTAWSEAEN